MKIIYLYKFIISSKFYWTLLLVLFCFFNTDFVFAQSTASYSFSNATNASLTDMSSGTTTILGGTFASQTADYASSVIDLGGLSPSFDFWFMGTRYYQFSVNSNGLLRLGSTVVSNTYTNDLNTVSDLPLLTAFWDDLDQNTTTSKVHYKVTGSFPNRILSIEWKDFLFVWSATAGSTSTFQIRLYEQTGIIEYVYGAMNNATTTNTTTASIGFTIGNANNSLLSVTNISTPAVTTSTASVNDLLVNNSTDGAITGLNSAADGSRVIYTFSQTAPTAPTSLTFTNIATTSMTLNWVDNASNEYGYVIYSSTDGSIYSFNQQVAAGSTSTLVTGLVTNTLYYFKVYAVREGALSTSLNGSQLTATAFTFTSTGSIVIPCGVTSIIVECWGAGGGGGSSDNTSTNGGSGGGGGAYAKGYHSVNAGSTYYYNVGTVGTGGPANSTTVPNAGGTAWFNATPSTNSPPGSSAIGTLAEGGRAGVNNTTSTPDNNGRATSSFGNLTTTDGSDGIAGSSSGGGSGGNGANPGGGSGGSGSSTTDGSNGTVPGGGGGGGNDLAANKGGDGALGQIIISYPVYTNAVSVSIAADANPICTGTSVTFTATPTNGGAGPAYQWKKNGTNVGTNSTTYIDAGLLTGDLITCVLTSNISCPTGNPATSNTIAMTVGTNFGTIDNTAQNVCFGGDPTVISFSTPPSGGGTGFNYLWYYKDGNNAAPVGTDPTGWTSTGVTTSTFDPPTGLATTRTFACMVDPTGAPNCDPSTWANSCCVVTVSIPTTPANPTAGAIGCASVTLAATGSAPAGETWYWQGTSCGTSTVLGSAPATYVATANNTYYIRSKLNSSACWSAGCGSVVVSLLDAPVIVTNPLSTYGCNSTAVTFSVVTTGAGLTYQWQENAVNISNGGVYSGCNTENLTISDPTGKDGKQYRCVVTGICAPVATSSVATLNVLANGLSGTKVIQNPIGGAAYSTLKAAFDDINSKGLIGNLILEINSDLTEVATASLNQWNSCGNSGYTVTIYPTGATRTISGNIATSLITLNGADNVTFDGRLGGSGAANSLIISNIDAAKTGSTITFVNDASYNTIKYCTIKGVENLTTNGLIFFSTATSTGNDYNTITYCNICDGATTPIVGIYALGTVGMENDNITVSYCNIYNQWKSGSTAYGFKLGVGNTKWIIQNNSIYNELSRSNCNFRGIYINNSDGNEFIIDGNKIGGSATNCGSGAMTFTTGAWDTYFWGIYLVNSTTGISQVINNTIKNINWTTTSKTDGDALFYGIFAGSGRVNVANNTLGDASTGSILLTINDNGSNRGWIVPIIKWGDGPVLNNSIGSFTIDGTINDQLGFNAIQVSGTLISDCLISENTIGSNTVANSIQTVAGATPTVTIGGIYFGTAGDYNTTVSNNRISNITQRCTASMPFFVGMYNQATAGTQTIIGNTIKDISTTTTNVNTFSTTNTMSAICGIASINTTNGGHTVSNNIIHSLTASAAASAVYAIGIVCHHTVAGPNTIGSNFIHSFNTASTTAVQNGIVIYAGTGEFNNNMVRLGILPDGTSLNTSTAITGINKSTTGNCNFYFNSVYIGGNDAGAGVNTFGFRRVTTGVDISKNNIYYNARTGSGKHYAIAINAITTFTSDYNVIFSSNAANLGSINGGAAALTWGNWKTAINAPKDAASYSSDPKFVNPALSAVSPPDLHILASSPGIGLGITIGGLAIDYDVEQRTNPGPCIGADERFASPVGKNAYGIYMPETQLTGNIIDCEISAIGGTFGGTGYKVANPVTTNYASVPISLYQTITIDNSSCTNSNIDFTTTDGTPDWLFGNGSTPSSSISTPQNDVQYSSTGRKDIIESVKVFKDFVNLTMTVPSAGSILGAPAGAGCPTTYNYTSSVAGNPGFSYSWSATAPGGCTATIALPTAFATDITFVNTTGYNQVFILRLNITTECCGPLTQVVRYITIWPGPLPPAVTGSPAAVCTGVALTAFVSSPDATYSYNWFDASTAGTNLGAGTSYSVVSAPTGSTSYYVESTNSFGCKSTRTPFVVNATDTPAPTVPGESACGNSSVTLSVTSPGSGYTYNWYSGSCGGTLLQSGAGASYTSTYGSTTTIYVQAVPPGCSASACSAPVVTFITPPALISWLGTTAPPNNWFNSTNWTSGCIPSCGTNVTIPNLGNDPDIGFDASGPASCQNITLQSGAVLSFSDSKAELDICGNFDHSGVFTSNNFGKLIFNSSTSAQTYTRSGSGDLNSVEILNTYSTPTVTLSNDLVLGTSGILSLVGGKLVTGANKVVVKNTTTTAIDGYSTSSFINGTLQRYVSAAGSFDFPVGTTSGSDYYELANINLNSSTGLTDFTASFTHVHTGTAPNASITMSNAVVETINTLLDNGFWTITPNVGMTAINYDVTLTARGQTNGGPIPTVHTIVKRTSAGPGTWTTYGAENGSHHNNNTQSGSGSNVTAVLTAMTSFSDLAIAKKSSNTFALSVELASFTARCENGFINCNWTTTSEINNDAFILEHSHDGETWVFVAEIKGAGNSNQQLNYEYIDKQQIGGQIYYRLSQRDFDGKIQMFNTIVTICKDDVYASMYIFPNPAKEDLSVVLTGHDNQKGEIVIIDPLGKKVLRKTIDSSNEFIKFDLDIRNLPSGNYFIHCILNNEVLPVQKFIIGRK